MWPQGVSVAFVGGKKHMGQVYSDRDSGCLSLSGAEGAGTGGMVEVEVLGLLIGGGSMSVGCRILARLGLLT